MVLTSGRGHRNNTTEDWGTPETSVNVTDATDLEDDEGVGFRAHWKRVSIKMCINFYLSIITTRLFIEKDMQL